MTQNKTNSELMEWINKNQINSGDAAFVWKDDLVNFLKNQVKKKGEV